MFNFYVPMTKPCHRHTCAHWHSRMWNSPHYIRIFFKSIWMRYTRKSKFLTSVDKLPKSRRSTRYFCSFCQGIHPHTANQRFQNKLERSISDSDRMTSPIWPHRCGFSVATDISLCTDSDIYLGTLMGNRCHDFPSSLCSQRSEGSKQP